MPTIVLVPKSSLWKTPKAFQQYVEDYFTERTVLGIPCFMAETHTINPNGIQPFRKGGGMAPSHSVDLMHYKEGLKKGQSLNAWMNEARDEGIITSLFASERRGNVIDMD